MRVTRVTRVLHGENMQIEQIKQANLLHSRGETFKSIEESTGISRTVLPHLLELYNLFENTTILEDNKSSEYVRVKKKRYMLQKIKLQHKIADIRKMYMQQLNVLKQKRKKLQKLADKQEDYDHLQKELSAKQLMLDVTSKNLQQAEDGYEYLKREVNYTKAISFIAGIGFVFFCMFIFKMLGGDIRIVL